MALLDNMKGSIEIRIPKTAYARGEKISGAVFLKVKSQIECRGGKISFKCLDEHTRGKHRHIEILYQEELPLSQKKVFSRDEEFNFGFEVPKGVGIRAGEGLFGQAMDFLAGRKIYWTLEAKLDLPMSLDISQKKFINIS